MAIRYFTFATFATFQHFDTSMEKLWVVVPGVSPREAPLDYNVRIQGPRARYGRPQILIPYINPDNPLNPISS